MATVARPTVRALQPTSAARVAWEGSHWPSAPRRFRSAVPTSSAVGVSRRARR